MKKGTLLFIVAAGVALSCSDDGGTSKMDSTVDTGQKQDTAGSPDGPAGGDLTKKGDTGPLKDSSKQQNLAPQATVAVSFNDNLRAYLTDGLGEGAKPNCSSYYYWFSKFPRNADKWISLTWTKAVTVGRISLDTFVKTGSVHSNCNSMDVGRTYAGATIQYWKGSAWVNIKTVSGKTDDWSATFHPLSTTKLRLLTPASITLTTNPVIFEWQVFAQ